MRLLVDRLIRQIHWTVGVVRLIEHIPRDNATVLREASDDTLHITAQLFEAGGVREHCSTGTLHPAGIMYVRDRCALRTEMRHWIPYRVKEHEHRSNVVSVGDREELIHATQKADRILLPEETVQEDAHRVEAERLCPSELTVNGTWVERRRLPHLELVDCRAGNKVAADKPARGIRPRVRPCPGPDGARWSARHDLGSRRLRAQIAERGAVQHHAEQQR